MLHLDDGMNKIRVWTFSLGFVLCLGENSSRYFRCSSMELQQSQWLKRDRYSTEPIRRWPCVSMERVRSRHWIERNRCCPCDRDKWNVEPRPQTQRYAIVIRCFGIEDQPGDRSVASPASFPRISFVLDTIEANVPSDLDIHIVMDNYGTHKTA